MGIKINSVVPASTIGAIESTLAQFQNEVNVTVCSFVVF
jgi:hypothetical protein